MTRVTSAQDRGRVTVLGTVQLEPAHQRQRPGPRQDHDRAALAERVRRGGQQVRHELVSCPHDVHLGPGPAVTGSRCQAGDSAEAHADGRPSSYLFLTYVLETEAEHGGDFEAWLQRAVLAAYLDADGRAED